MYNTVGLNKEALWRAAHPGVDFQVRYVIQTVLKHEIGPHCSGLFVFTSEGKDFDLCCDVTTPEINQETTKETSVRRKWEHWVLIFPLRKNSDITRIHCVTNTLNSDVYNLSRVS